MTARVVTDDLEDRPFVCDANAPHAFGRGRDAVPERLDLGDLGGAEDDLELGVRRLHRAVNAVRSRTYAASRVRISGSVSGRTP